jgi:glycosyltransferase involved in cell wall biosynthesis
LQQLFPAPRRHIVGAAGRLSPEKGFGVLVDAAAIAVRSDPDLGFVVFGEGPLRPDLERAVLDRGLRGSFVFAGFRGDLDRLMPHFDLLALPSFTEGLPNVALEASAARVPVVATAVGGTPEVIRDGVTGYLVPPGLPADLAGRILDAVRSEEQRRAMGQRGRQWVEKSFTFEAQGLRYLELFEQLARRPAGVPTAQDT